MKIAITLIILLLVVLTGEKSLASSYDDYQSFRKGTYDFQLETQFFRSDANYISSGDSFQRLSNGQSFELWDVYFKFRYDLSRRSAWYANVDVATANSTGFDAKRSNSSLASSVLGYAYMIYSDDFDAITDFNMTIPYNQISANTDTVMNSEGVMEGTALLRLQKTYDMFAIYGYGGGTYRQSRSALIPWGAGAELRWNSITLGGKIFGYQTIMDDPDKDNKNQRLIVNDRVNGGSLKFYAVNPSLIDSEIYAKFKMGRSWTLTGGGGTTISGASTASGFHFGLNLAFSWDSQPSYYLRPGSGSEDDLSSERKVPRFKEETNDGVDQKIFEKKAQPPPAKPRPRPSSGQLAPAEEAVAVRKAPQPEPTPVINDADGGEVQLKLKRKKKRRS